MEEQSKITGICPFCDVNLADNAFMHSKNFIAIYNIAPVLRGHSLVIPKAHKESIFEFTKSELTELANFSREVTNLLLKAFKGEGFDWSIQEGVAAGQSVPHLHLHIVIRNTQDLAGEPDWWKKVREQEKDILDSSSRNRLSAEEYKFYTEYIKNELKTNFK